MRNRLALVCAVPAEAAPLLSLLRDVRAHELGPGLFHSGARGPVTVLVITAGVGKVNAAQSLTLALERFPIWGVISWGIGGGFSAAGLSPGDLAIAESETYGDEGVETESGFRGAASLGFPREARVKELFLADPKLRSLLMEAVPAGTRAVCGPFVTVSLCSGTDSRARWMRKRFRSVCESMEGAAVAQVADAYGIPFAEVRGISNSVGKRDRKVWTIDQAAEMSAGTVDRFLASLPRSGAAWST